jgi:SAM-dependent methyltransferase
MSVVVAAEMVARGCPLCGKAGPPARVFAEANFALERLDRFAFASRKLPEYMHYRLLECPGCDLVYASPVPTAGALARAYRDAGFDSGLEAHRAAATYARLLIPIAARLPDRAGALDIGAGDGAFLAELLAAGFTGVAGVEPSDAPIAAASDEIRPLIRRGVFRREDFDAGRFSLVSCFQTLEHVDDPMAIARAAFALLKRGGAAFFIVHNRRALSARVLGRKSPIFDIEHLQLFSPESARSLLEHAGFVDVKVGPIVNCYPLQYWLKLAPVPAKWKPKVLAACARSGVGRVPVAMPVGNLAAFGFKPEERTPTRGNTRVDRGVRR